MGQLRRDDAFRDQDRGEVLGHLQSWRQKELSQIKFSGLIGRAYSYETNAFDAAPSLRADLYVFALHTCQDPDQYDVLDLAAWQFYVVPVAILREHNSPKSVTKVFLDRVAAAPVGYTKLSATIEAAVS